MGRKAIGDKPMTNAEKQKAYRERQDLKIKEMATKLEELRDLIQKF